MQLVRVLAILLLVLVYDDMKQLVVVYAKLLVRTLAESICLFIYYFDMPFWLSLGLSISAIALVFGFNLSIAFTFLTFFILFTPK